MFWRKTLIYKESVIVAMLILYASLIRAPHFQLPPVAFADKWSHLLAYAVLGCALTVNMIRDEVGKRGLWLIGLLVPIAYGGIIEIVQGAFFPPRTADWWDWIADIVGTVIGTGIVMMIWQARKR